MTHAKSRDAIRQFDRHAIEDLGIPGIVLMETAGRQIAAAARDMIQGAADPKVVILAGRGSGTVVRACSVPRCAARRRRT